MAARQEMERTSPSQMNRRDFIGLSLKYGRHVAAAATVAATADAWNYGIWNPPKDDPLYRRENQLRAEKADLEKQIVSSRDARENAVRREQINILDRDLYQVYRDQVEQQGPILGRTRGGVGVLIGTSITILIGLFYLTKATEFIQSKRASAAHPTQTK